MSQRALFGVTCLLLGLTGTRARAHPEVTPTAVNRYLSAAVLGHQVEVSVALLFGALPGVEERQRMDTNHDGRIDPSEAEAAQAVWTSKAPELLSVRVDQAAFAEAPTVKVDLGQNDAVTPAPLVVEAVWRKTISQAEHTLMLGPALDPPRVGETEVGVILASDWKLLHSQQGQQPSSAQSVFKIPAMDNGATADRMVTFVFAPSGTRPAVAADGAKPALPDQSQPPRELVALIALVLISTGAIVWRLRKRASR